MSKPEIVSSCELEAKLHRGPAHTEMPFGENDELHPVRHAEQITLSVVEFSDGPPLGGVGMLYGRAGLYVAYDAADLRDVARALTSMADEIDAKVSTRQ